MTNPFSMEAIQPPAEPTTDNPFALGNIQNDQAAQLRNTLRTAVQTKADAASEVSRLRKRYPAPEDVLLRNLEEAKYIEAADIAGETLKVSPILADNLRKHPWLAREAHPDIKPLAGMEERVRKYGELRAWNGPEPTFGSVLSGLAKSVPQGFRAARAGLDLQMTDALEALGLIEPDPIFKADRLRKAAQASGASSFTTPDFESSTASGVYGGVASTLRMLPGLAMSLATKSPAPALASAGVQTEAESYVKYRARGAEPGMATLAAVGEGAVEVATELPAMKFLVGKLGKAGASEFIAGLIAREIPGEQVATLLQDAIDTAVANPDKTWEQYLSERPEAAYQTLVATLTQSTILGGVNVAVERFARDNNRQADAMGDAEHLQDQLRMAAGVALRENNPDEFRTLVQAMADNTEGAPKEVYVDAEVLNQLAPEVLAQLPGVAAQMADALAANSVVSIPVGDVLTVAPGTPLEKLLVENARIGDPNAMSQVEAKMAGEKAQEFLAQEAQRVIQQATDQQAMQESSDRVKQGVLDQLNTVGRFRKEVNEGYATWTAAFYTTMAGRLGITPEEMAAKYPLRIVGKTGASPSVGQVEGGKVGELSVEAYNFGKSNRTTLSGSNFGMGLAGSNKDLYLNAADKRLSKRIYFYVDKGTGINPEAGVGGIARKFNLTNVYDGDTDPLRLKTGRDQLGFESAVLDAGFSGYLTRMDGTQSGQVILLGDQTVTGELLGPTTRTTGKVVPEKGTREAKGRDAVVDALNANTALPAGQAPLWMWKNALSKQPEVLAALTSAGIFEASENTKYYKSELIKAYQDATPTESYAQRAERPVRTAVSVVADISNARVIAASRKWPSNRDFKMAIQDAMRTVMGTRDLRKDTPQNRAYIGRQILKEAREALVTNSNAIGWYDEKVTIALAVASVVHPELATDEQSRFAFTWALAVTSNGVKVGKNFEMANRAYGLWKASDADPAKRRMPTTGIGIGPTAGKIHEALATYNDLIARWGYERFKAFATTLQPNRQVKADFGRGVSGEGMDTMVYGAGVVGPKIGNGFFMNLYGEFGQLTMDRWWVRMWGRITGDLVEVDREKTKASRDAFVSIIEMVKADKAATRAVEQAIGTRLGKGNPVEMAKALIKASADEDVRNALDAVLPATPEREAAVTAARGKPKAFVSIGDELRKAAKAYYGNLDGQIEVPGGSRRRDMMRAVSQTVLAELQKEHPNLTMADFQALMWYPEKTLYDSAGTQEQDADGYDDDEAPDYANAAVALARQQGVSDDQINAAIERARSEIETRRLARGSGRGAAGVQAEGGNGAGTDTGTPDQPPAGGVDGRLEQAGNRGGRYSGGGLAPLAGAPSHAGATGPIADVVAVAEQYARDNGIDLRRQAEYVRVDPDLGRRIADAYTAMAHTPDDPRVQASYDALIRETRAQYDALVGAGYTFTFFDSANDPYKGNPWPALRDLRDNKAMAVYGTYDGYGNEVTGFETTKNLLVVPTGLQWPDQAGVMRDVTANDLFRAVHDAFGHGLEGAGFRGQGEANAFEAHARLFSPAAMMALTTETRAQNSWLNLNGALLRDMVGDARAEELHPDNWQTINVGEHNQTAKVEDTIFADQKNGILPEWTWTEGRAGDQSEVLNQSVSQTDTPEFKAWFDDSKVVDANGQPLVVYHGTDQTDDFNDGEAIIQFMDFRPVWFATSTYTSDGYTNPRGIGSPTTYPVYLSIKNPLRLSFDMDDTDASAAMSAARRLGVSAEDVETYADGPAYDLVRSRPFVEAARAKGYDGIAVKEGGELTYAAFDSTQIKSAIGNRGTFDPTDPSILNQGPRGTFAPANLELALNENADLSTFLHETGHFFLEVMADLSSQPGAPADIADDMGKLLKWFGVKDLETWNALPLDSKRPYHERFAESFEQYLMEGKAPSVELQPLFRKFRAWLLNVYSSIKAFVDGRDATTGIQLSDEIRQVFDRMLASQEQIAQAEEVAGLLPEEDATAEALEKLTVRSLRDLKWTVNARAKAIKELQKQAATLRKGVEAEVRAEVEAMPIYRAINFLKYGKLVEEGMTNAQRKALDEVAGVKVKLDLPALRAIYGDGPAAPWRYLSTGKNGLAASEGVHPDIVADILADPSFPDGDTLVRAILAAESEASVIEGMTDQRMLERHGDLIDQRAVEAAANEAVHNEARARSLATELKSQAEALNPRKDTGQTNAAGSKITVNALVEAAKQFGANIVSKTPLRDLKAKAAEHTAAERRAGKRWTEATSEGKTEEAIKAKQDQMLNHAAARAAMDAQAEMRKMLEFFRKVVKDGNEKTVSKGRDPDVVNAARAILGAYGVAPKGAKTAMEYMALVEKNDPAMFAALQPSMQGALNMAQPLDALTMDELRGLHEEIQAMWHLAKRSRQMEVDGNMVDIDDAADELQTRMQAIGVPDTMPGDTSAITPREKATRALQFAGSLLRRTEQWAAGMGKEFTRLVFQPVKDAANAYRADRVKYRKAYQALVDNVAPALIAGPIAAPELGYTFGKGHNGIGHAELLHAILHTGNESNKRKLLLGRGWATQNEDGTMDTSRWDAFLQRMHNTGTLNKAHYDFAQNVWDLLEQTKPLAQKTHRDVFGRYFAEVTADSFDTPFGSYRGGYVPAQADPRIVTDADLRKLAEAENESMAFSFPGTNKGFTKGRVEYNRPLMLDLRTIGQHIDKVLLFSHMEPAVRDVQKLLSQKGVSYSLSRIDPTIYAGMLTPWLNRSARQIVETPIVGDGGISRVLSAARNRAGMALMFANVSNALQQLSGFLSAMSKLKADNLNSNMMAATAQFIASPKQTAKAVADASPFMASRMENEIAAINDAMDAILLDPSLYEKAQAWTQKHAYFLQTAMANTMEPIIWTAGYNGALQKGMTEKEAARYADGLIRTTQGSTLPEDVSRIETGPAYARIFTQFIGYFNMMANTNATALMQISQEMGLKKGAGKALGVVTLGMLAPLWVAEAIAQAMRGGPEDEDDDGYLDDWLAAVFGMGTIKGTLAMVPFVGQLANAAMNRFNNNPADDKVSLSPAVSLLEASAGVPKLVYQSIADPEKINARNAVRDVASAVSIATGLPAVAVARPLGYLAGVADDRIDPTGPVDMARGLITGTPSPESK